MDTEHIRNFSIIAHIDHGKSTLADRLIEITGTVQKRDMEAQILDTMELERERGITIKEQSVRLNYTYEDGETYELNLIDTPGHVDFNYEVSRSLSACEGAILIIDATQGVQAQTLANVYLALDHDLEIIPVINKVDLPSADVERVKTEVENVIGLDMSEAIPVSAKTGQNVEEVLKRIVEQVPPPEDHSKAPLRCLIFDSIFDSYKGAIAYVRVKDGEIRATSSPAARSATWQPASRTSPTAKSGIPSRPKRAAPPKHCRATARHFRWFSAASTRSRARTMTT